METYFADYEPGGVNTVVRGELNGKSVTAKMETVQNSHSVVIAGLPGKRQGVEVNC